MGSLFYTALGLSGTNALLRRFQRSRPLVLCYYSMIPDRDPGERLLDQDAVTVSAFREQMSLLTRWFEPVSLEVFSELVESRQPPRRPTVLVTLDDGYRTISFTRPRSWKSLAFLRPVSSRPVRLDNGNCCGPPSWT